MANQAQLILIDTNILLSYLRGHQATYHRLRQLSPEQKCISIITYGEVLVGTKKGKKRATLSFLRSFRIIELNTQISFLLRGIFNESYYREGLMADSLIAATAIVYDLPVWTNNKKDFKSVKEIRFYNPP